MTIGIMRVAANRSANALDEQRPLAVHDGIVDKSHPCHKKARGTTSVAHTQGEPR